MNHLILTPSGISSEIHSIDESIADLQRVRSHLISQREQAQYELEALSNSSRNLLPPTSITSTDKGKQKMAGGGGTIDYTQEFDWSEALKANMKAIFKINSFRLCQEGFV